ncbi:MAG: HDOD domain-containing protein, partial [Myxococcales bacterium]|nr:HDOD domain-containing protein [Myxococcales bacterium]
MNENVASLPPPLAGGTPPPGTFGSALELPIPPSVLCHLIGLMDSPNRDGRSISQAVCADPGLAAEALRVANSAAMGRREKATTITAAVVSLGEQQLRELIARRLRLVLGRDAIPGYDMFDEGLWRHAIRVAAACRHLAPRLGVAPALAYTTGLLADVGKLLLGEHVDARWHELVDLLAENGELTFDEAERQLFGVDHASLGADQAVRWQLPDDVCAGIRFHHAPSAAGEHVDLATIVHLADSLELSTGVGQGSDGLRYRVDPAAIARASLTAEDVDTIIADVEADVA